MDENWVIGNRRGIPPDVGRIGNPPHAEHQICWSITANPKEPENCYVDPIYKTAASADQIQKSDRATLTVLGMGCENCATRVRNSLLLLEGVYGVEFIQLTVNHLTSFIY